MGVKLYLLSTRNKNIALEMLNCKSAVEIGSKTELGGTLNGLKKGRLKSNPYIQYDSSDL